MGLFLVDGQTLACDGFAVLGVEVRGHSLDSFAVQSCTGKVGQTNFVTAYLKIVCSALCKSFLDLGFERFLFGLCCLNQLGGFLVLLYKDE
uniref:hypothetical protein n=1 Tax=Faecalibacterium prausnitzii TaxID=853 RepID=UPI003FF0E73F